MKRVASSLLLILILFNSIGYYGVLLVIEDRLTSEMIHKIDDNAAEISGDLMLSLPIDIPYSHDSENYERVDGEIVYRNEVFRLVKQKRYKNNLYVICVRDDKSTQVREEMDEYSRTFSNQQPDSSDAAVKIVAPCAKYYLPIDFISTPALGVSAQLPAFAVPGNFYQFFGNDSVFQPPRM